MEHVLGLTNDDLERACRYRSGRSRRIVEGGPVNVKTFVTTPTSNARHRRTVGRRS